MPTFNRKNLRRRLGARYTHDLLFDHLYNASLTTANGTSPVSAYAQQLADSGDAGKGLYQGAWLYLEGSVPSPGDISATAYYQYAIGSYNSGSGAFISTAYAQDNHNTWSSFEVHTRISPLDKNSAIDDTITRLRVRQEVPIWTLDGSRFYVIDGAASPFVIDRILNIHVAADPANSLNPDIRTVADWDTVLTGSGNLLRLATGIGGSQQILVDAILIPTLSGELGTINLPSERWVLAGAAMKCYDYMIQAAPAQQVNQLMQRRAEFANEFSRLSTRHQPSFDHDVKLHDVTRNQGGIAWHDPLW